MRNAAVRLAGVTGLLLLISSEAAAGICVDMTLRFGGEQPAGALVRALRDEVSAIWSPYGVEIRWLSAAGTERCARAQGSFDVLVDRQPIHLSTASGRTVLGSTQVAPSGLGHADIHVDYDSTERIVGELPESRLIALVGHPDRGPADLGRALGRVLAHEVGHLILAVTRHADWGLMRPWFAPDELVGQHRSAFSLSKQDVARLRQREYALEWW